jgi:N-acetylglucosamine kinase-like BadF-type ATPase
VSPFVIGVDGGGSRTRAVALDAAGVELARAEGGSAVAGSPDKAAGAVAEVCRQVAGLAGRSLPAQVVWAGLSGAGRESARSAAERALEETGVAVRAWVGTDVHAAFHDVFPEGPGILLIAGTGSIAWARSEDGREDRVGGWGPRIGDEGSGYAIGVEVLRRVARHADGRAQATALSGLVRNHLELGRVEDLAGWAARASRAQIAELAPLAAAAAAGGDEAAGQIMKDAIEALRAHIVAILERMGPWSRAPELALAGGLIRPGGALRDALEGALSSNRLRTMTRDPDAARGAARLALGLLSGDLGGAPLSN